MWPENIGQELWSKGFSNYFWFMGKLKRNIPFMWFAGVTLLQTTEKGFEVLFTFLADNYWRFQVKFTNLVLNHQRYQDLLTILAHDH